MDLSIEPLLERLYREESRRGLATPILPRGAFELAEEALHEAFRAAREQWPNQGVPANPRAWLVSAGRFKAIDQLRRQARFQALDDVEEPAGGEAWDGEHLEDD